MSKPGNGNTRTFMEEVMASVPDGERLQLCLQCGTCGGSCPNGPDMDYTPRRLFAMLAAGMREEVLSANTMWYCVSCYFCTERCPQDIPITDIMYTLKRMAIAEGYAREADAPALARAFTGFVDQYGRSFEFGLASSFYLTQKPGRLVSMGPLGLTLMQHGRMSLRPNRIKNIKQLRAIIAKAQELAPTGEAGR